MVTDDGGPMVSRARGNAIRLPRNRVPEPGWAPCRVCGYLESVDDDGRTAAHPIDAGPGGWITCSGTGYVPAVPASAK